VGDTSSVLFKFVSEELKSVNSFVDRFGEDFTGKFTPKDVDNLFFIINQSQEAVENFVRFAVLTNIVEGSSVFDRVFEFFFGEDVPRLEDLGVSSLGELFLFEFSVLFLILDDIVDEVFRVFFVDGEVSSSFLLFVFGVLSQRGDFFGRNFTLELVQVFKEIIVDSGSAEDLNLFLSNDGLIKDFLFFDSFKDDQRKMGIKEFGGFM